MPTHEHAGVRAVLRRDRRHAAGRPLALRRARSTARSGSRCARSSAARSTSSCRPPPATTPSCCRSARTTASRSTRCPATSAAATVDDTLEHAILDSPMFQARWRWNLNRSLHGAAVPQRAAQPAAHPAHGVRRPHGRGVPAGGRVPGERHRPDRDPRPRPRPPDRSTTRCTRRSTSTACARCSSASRRARCRCTASTPPSRRCSRTRSSPPGPTPSSTTRSCRTAAPTPSRCGGASRSTSPRSARSTPTPSSGCTTRSRRDPTTADDLHDLLRRSSSCRPRAEWQPLFDELVAARARAGARAATAGAVVHHRARRRRASRLAGERGARRHACLRGHLEIAGITTVDDLADATTLATGRVRRRPRRARARAASPCRGATRPDAGRHRVGGAPAAGAHALLLAADPPAAVSSRPPPRTSCASCCAGSTSRPAPSCAARPACSRCSSSSRATRRPRSRGSPSCFGPALRTTTPAGSTGCATTARSPGCGSARARRDVDAPAGRARPRPRRSRWCSAHDLAGCSRGAGAGAVPCEPAVGATAEVLEVLRARGAVLRRRARRRHRRLPDDIERALWDGVARGLLTVRRVRRDPRARRPAATPAPTDARAGSRGCARGPRLAGHAPAAGRSCRARSRAPPDVDRTSWPRRWPSSCSPWGVVFRDLVRPRLAALAVARHPVGAAPPRRPWPGAGRPFRQRLQRRAVRAARGGRAARPRPQAARTGERVVVNATDPLNLVGVVVPGATVPAVRTRQVVYVDGVPEGTEADEHAAQRLTARGSRGEHALGLPSTSTATTPRCSTTTTTTARPPACPVVPPTPELVEGSSSPSPGGARHRARRSTNPRGRGHRRARRHQHGHGGLSARVHAGGRRRRARPPAREGELPQRHRHAVGRGTGRGRSTGQARLRLDVQLPCRMLRTRLARQRDDRSHAAARGAQRVSLPSRTSSTAATYSTPARYSFCFGEDEEGASPWVPMSVEGSIAAGTERGHRALGDDDEAGARPLQPHPRRACSTAVCRAHPQHRGVGHRRMVGIENTVMLVMGPEHRRFLVDAGWSKDDTPRLSLPLLKGWVSDLVRIGKPEGILIVAAGGPGMSETWVLLPPPGVGHHRASRPRRDRREHRALEAEE